MLSEWFGRHKDLSDEFIANLVNNELGERTKEKIAKSYKEIAGKSFVPSFFRAFALQNFCLNLLRV